MNFGIHDINKIAENENIVRCNNCDNYFYEEIIGLRENCYIMHDLWLYLVIITTKNEKHINTTYI